MNTIGSIESVPYNPTKEPVPGLVNIGVAEVGLSVDQPGEGDTTDTVSGLASLVNSIAGDFHYIHFYAVGQGGHWDRIHEIAGAYYEALGDDYDSLAELALQLGENITHPNDTASAIGFDNTQTALASTDLTYESAVSIMRARLASMCSAASKLLAFYQTLGVGETAVRNYVEDFIMRWSKEYGYKLTRRLS